MPTESSPLCDGAKIDVSGAPNAPLQKVVPELSRPKTDVTHQFFDPHDVGCIKAAANGTKSRGRGSAPEKALVNDLDGAPVILSSQGALKDAAKTGSVRKPLSLDDEENVDEDEDASDEEEEYEDEDEEEEEQDEEDEEQGESEEYEDEHEKNHLSDDEYEDGDELSEPPPKRKK